MDTEDQDINQEVDQIKADLKGLRDDVSSLLHTMRDAGVNEGYAARERVRNYGQRARARVSEGFDSVHDTVGKEIEDRPLASTLTAFGVGFVVGMLLDRRR